MDNNKPISDRELYEAASGSISDLNFRDQDLSNSIAPKNATFIDCDFSGANLKGVDISGTNFENCLFQQTDFTAATLTGCTFAKECSLHGAILERVDATTAKFIGADLQSATASGGNFYKAEFTGSKLRRAIFDRADLTEVIAFEPDQTSVYRAVFSSAKPDPWTALRFEFTGIKLVLALLPPMIFLVSLLLEAYASLGASYYYANAAGVGICEGEGSNCVEYAIWQILLGQREGPLAVTFVLYSAIYNVARFALTMVVSSLAHAEDRSSVTPPRKGNIGVKSLTYASWVIWFAKWGMLILFAINMWNLVIKTVLLPVG